jgi:two-component system LytT family response regulator
MSINTIIVEDEPLSMAFLKNLLAEYCPEVSIVATATTEADAIAAIAALQPHLVLMDIELQQGNGFGVLQGTREYDYHIVFTTALDYSGIRSIRFSGVNYLQKPIDIDSLQTVITAINEAEKERSKTAVKHLLQTLDNNNEPSTLLLNTMNGGYYIPLEEIVFIMTQGSNCIFYTANEIITAIGSNLRDYELLLNEPAFFRLHSDYIIQLGKVDLHSKVETGTVKMINKAVIPVSPKKQAALGSLLSITA